MKHKYLFALGLSVVIGTCAIRTLTFPAHAQAPLSFSETAQTPSPITVGVEGSPDASASILSDELKTAFYLVESANIDEIEAKVDDAKRAAELTLRQREKI